MSAISIVGAVLVRNEDVFVERAIRNAAGFCDVVHVADNGSTDGTWAILERLERDLGNVDVRLVPDIRDSHEMVERYAGTDTWIFGVDGDEVYDPVGLVRLRDELLSGMYGDRFRIKSNVLNCVAVDPVGRTASGYLAPPSRPMTKLFNFAAVERWSGPALQLLHGGDRIFRDGYDNADSENICDRYDWDRSYFRCLHCCFVQRSSLDPVELSANGRWSPVELAEQRWASVRRLLGGSRRSRFTSNWKLEKYRRGPLVTVDATAFFADQPTAKRAGSDMSEPTSPTRAKLRSDSDRSAAGDE